MDITIRIEDDSRFNDIIKNELNALKPEELHEVVLSAIREALVANDYKIAKELILEPKANYWEPDKFSTFTHKVIESCDFSQVQDIVNVTINHLKDNYKDLLEKLLLDTITKGLCESYAFRESVKNALYEIRSRESN